MNFKEIQDLIKLINKSNLSEFRMKDGDFELLIRTNEYIKAKRASAAPLPQHVVSIPAGPIVSTPQQDVTNVAPIINNVGSATKEDKVENNYIEIKSPMVGTFYRSASPDKPPYIEVGDIVEPGSVVCIVEAMKLFNDIESEVKGRVAKVLVDNASPVEYDQVLFLVEPA